MKGMQKIKRGTGFRGVLDYAIGDGDGQIIGGNMSGVTCRQLAKEFGASRDLRQDIEKPVWHNSLRLPAGDKISNEKWNEIADKYFEKMGFTDLHQRVYVMHDDRDGQHIHLIASRIALDKSVYLGKQENLISTRHIQDIEKEFGLTITRGPSPGDGAVKKPKKNEIGLSERTGFAPMRMQLQSIIDIAVADKPVFSEFIDRLSDAGVSILPSGKTGGAQGISFEINGQNFKGSDLGKSYAWKSLQARIDFDKDRDQSVIDDLRAVAAKEDEEIGTLEPATEYLAEPSELLPPKGRSFQLQRGDARHNAESKVPSTGSAGYSIRQTELSAQGESYTNAKEKSRASLYPPPEGRGFTDKFVKYNGQPRTLELALEKVGDNYQWKGKSTVVLIDHGERISVLSKSDSAIKASLQLAKDKEWPSIMATGNAEFRRKSWLIGSEMGLEIDGYEPNQTDKDELKTILERKLVQKNGRKNGGAKEQSRSSSAAENDNDGARGAGAEDGGQSIVDSRRSARSDNRSDGSEGRTRQKFGDIVDIQTAAANHPRSAITAIADSGGSNRSGIGAVRLVADNLSDLAATREPVSMRAVSKEYAAKIAAWDMQHAALGAQKYRIQLKPRSEKDSFGKRLYEQNYGNKGNKNTRKEAGVEERFWSSTEVRDEIYRLRAKNAQGYDIYIVPIDDSKHYILVDDLKNDAVKGCQLTNLLAAGVEPAIIQRSSAGNKQAIIIIDKVKHGDKKDYEKEQAMANEIVVRLNKKFGDPKLTGVIHAFRMAGFSNKKDGKENYLTTIELSISRRCKIVSVEMHKLRDVDTAKKIEVDKLKKQDADIKDLKESTYKKVICLDSMVGSSVDNAYKRAAKMQQGLNRKLGWTDDWSVIDFAVSKKLLKDGYRADLISDAIMSSSPGLSDRHSDVDDYIARTVANACLDSGVIKSQRERAQRASNDDHDMER